jgi:uncharacterized Zn-binding protein involved in type VI secretion
MPPAARKGDMTLHGGIITAGEDKVLIGYLPAARVGDDHTCPLSDGPKPHKGGPVAPPGCPQVLIGYAPAARMGDKAVCVGTPDAIAKGEPTVSIG